MASRYEHLPEYAPYGQRGVPDEVIEAFMALDDACAERGEVEALPAWAYAPYGAYRRSPVIPGQVSYHTPPPTQADIDETTALFEYESHRNQPAFRPPRY